MKTASEIDWSLNRILTILVSAIIHAALMVGICCTATEQREKPIVHETKLIEVLQAKKKETPPPKPEPPKPEPPKPEPPKPEPPKPEPPKPEPPKPEPPKPVEVKPEPPKPTVVKTDTPKPEAPKQTLTKKDDILARLNNAPTKKMDPQPQRPQPQSYPPPHPVKPVKYKSAEEIAKDAMRNVPADTGVNLSTTAGSTVAEDSANYAENFVSPRLYQYWSPSRAGMKYAKPNPVYITRTVSANGRVRNAKITTPSNDPVMNNSVDELVRQINSGHIIFAPFQEAGINNRSYLTVEIGLILKD